MRAAVAIILTIAVSLTGCVGIGGEGTTAPSHSQSVEEFGTTVLKKIQERDFVALRNLTYTEGASEKLKRFYFKGVEDGINKGAVYRGAKTPKFSRTDYRWSWGDFPMQVEELSMTVDLITEPSQWLVYEAAEYTDGPDLIFACRRIEGRWLMIAPKQINK